MQMIEWIYIILLSNLSYKRDGVNSFTRYGLYHQFTDLVFASLRSDCAAHVEHFFSHFEFCGGGVGWVWNQHLLLECLVIAFGHDKQCGEILKEFVSFIMA